MNKIIYIILIPVILFLYTLTVRGNVGNPTPQQIEYQLNSSGQAFETSQERSRWALILSLADYKTVNIDHYASMGTPDIGQINGHYFSFFPIGASLMAMPLYLLGKLVGMSQIFTFSVSTIFAFLTVLLIAKFTQKLELHWSTSLFSALAFGFATNAWGYSVTLYAHLISAFFILSALYLTVFWENKHALQKGLLVWLCYAVGVFLDFPNLFIFMPIAFLLTFQGINWETVKNNIKLSINWAYVFTPLLFIALMCGYGYYNYVNFGNATTLSNSIPRVKDLKIQELSVAEKHKNAGQALNTRNMLEGFNSFLISNDRGLLVYSPIVLLSVLGLGVLNKKRKLAEVGLLAVPLTCLVLYTMFGDPYGGWAFGSRYMIAVLPELCILAGIGLQRFSLNIFMKILYSIVFIYSAGVSLLAPLTTNVVPPFVEARNLGLTSNYTLNWQMLTHDHLNSYIYNYILHTSIPGVVYYFIILAIVCIVGLTALWFPKKGKYDIYPA